MEEVWNDISLSLSSLYNHHSSAASAAVHHFQDFLDHSPLSSKTQKPPSNDDKSHHGLGAAVHGGAPATSLSLGTGAQAKKRRFLFVDGSNEDKAEKHKRLMKNRESADRSRARKQAYTLELEKEVERLKRENAMLKGQLKMVTSLGHTHLPKKQTLHRTLTAPF